MNTITTVRHFNWRCKHSWKISARNTAWCLLGCSLGDNLTILFFQWYAPHTVMWLIMLTAMLIGLLSSVGLETLILRQQVRFNQAVKIALGMSFVSMLMMEIAANVISIIFAGGDRLMLTPWSLLPSWLAGFLAAWPYNYYKLKKHGKSCH
jgi:hypothetical protein